ncbi:hypothetical protein ACPPVQ_13300 [Diaminobutyricibacter sp. McL0618]|uniref:hypothetical protein n=1 Tax=Leifsonia sp. McL0618 TaxID=3415677 RepID=UPI003CE7E25C
MRRGISIGAYWVLAVWTIAQPLINGLLGNPRWLGVTVWVFGLVVFAGLYTATRYSLAKPYREVLRAARASHPDSVVFGVRLDPITTPVGVEWGDSRLIQWGLIRAAPAGIEIVRSDGTTMLARPWDEVELASDYQTRLYVRTAETSEEWWIPQISDSGIWPIGFSSRQLVARRINRMLAVRANQG